MLPLKISDLIIYFLSYVTLNYFVVTILYAKHFIHTIYSTFIEKKRHCLQHKEVDQINSGRRKYLHIPEINGPSSFHNSFSNGMHCICFHSSS